MSASSIAEEFSSIREFAIALPFSFISVESCIVRLFGDFKTAECMPLSMNLGEGNFSAFFSRSEKSCLISSHDCMKKRQIERIAVS